MSIHTSLRELERTPSHSVVEAMNPSLVCHREERSRFDKLKAPSLSRGWIATPAFLGLAMTIIDVKFSR
jgi:hypothetical protein